MDINKFIVITKTNGIVEVLPLDRIIIIKRNDDKATIICDNKLYFPKEPYSQLIETRQTFL